jgi:hypothetical protein
MEEFTILFGVTDQEAKQNDYYYSGFSLKRNLSENSGLNLFQKAVPVLCSRELGIGDNVFVHLSTGTPVSLGKVLELDKKNGNAEIEIFDKIIIDNQLFVTNHFNQTIRAKIQDCFFPIIEIAHTDSELHLYELQSVKRNELYFRTVCPKCSFSNRNPEPCDTFGGDCQNHNKKQLAFIK